MGFLLVFFPEEKIKLSSSSSSSTSSSSSPLSSFIKSSKNPSHLLSKAQSIISICALLVFITLLLFTLSTFEPSSSSNNSSSSSRRHLSEIPSKSHYNKNGGFDFPRFSVFNKPTAYALQKMGTLYRRGTNAMNNLIVVHIVESLSLNDLRLFLRVLHKSNLISRSDLLFIFPSKSLLSALQLHSTILEEHNSFLKLIQHYQSNSTLKTDPSTRMILKWSKVEKGSAEPIWGRRIRSNSSEQQGNNSNNNGTGSTQLSYGSIVGFDVDELDPENALSGFMDHVPMSLRRWACYPMLLGRVKRNFKHVMLVDIKEMLLINDPSHRVKNPSPDSVHLFSTTLAQSAFTKRPKKNSDKTRSKSVVSPAIIYGGEKGVRRLSNAMLTEIVRKSVQNKKKNSVTEFVVFNQLVSNEFLLTNVKLVMQSDSIPELSSLSESSLKQGSSSSSSSEIAVIRKDNSNSDASFTMVKILLCSSMLDSLFYSDC